MNTLRSHGRWIGFTAGLLGVMGLALAGGGIWLARLGGSWYYLAAGLALLLVAVLLKMGHWLALWVYAAFVLATAAWSLWEVGLDWWGLAARGDVFFLVGLWLCGPWIVRHLRGPRPAAESTEAPRGPSAVSFSRKALAGCLVAYLLIAMASWLVDPYAVRGTLQEAGAPAQASPAEAVPAGEWHAYGRTAAGQRYSPLDRIRPDNIDQLKVAWTYHSGDLRGRPGDPVETTYEVTPLKIDDRLFLCTAHQIVVALDATTGAELWRFDPRIANNLAWQHLTCRGLSYQAPRQRDTVRLQAAIPGATASDCLAKLFMPTADGRLIALNPVNGKVCPAFGVDGQLDLWEGMPNKKPGSYYSTSPVMVTDRLVIVGGTVLDNVSTKETSGVIRAYDVDTGKLVWNWDAAKPEATAPLPPGQTYTPNSPNSWSIMSADEKLGMVYVPMGNQPPDQWGAQRSPAVERHASSVVALDLATGRVKWVFQTVHHDLWDYDVPAQPSLVDLTISGSVVPALVQPTKQGEIFVLDRRTGAPLLPVHETPAPQGAAAGDRTAPTQPVSALSFNPKPLTGASMWGATPFDQLYCRIAFHRLRYDGRFTPPSTQGSLIYPGNFGVFNWGGIAVDPIRQIAFTTPDDLAFVSQLVPRPDNHAMIVQGGERPHDSLPALNENFGAPYAVKLHAFTSPLGIPCQAPPWGHVAGADLTTGKVVWQHRNGTVRDLSPLPLPFRMGVPNLGGPIVTGGGVAFLSGTLDDYVRGYDVRTGEELWRSRLPAGGQATPMSYLGSDGRQYVLVVAGGHGSLGTKAGDAIVAYALPRSEQAVPK